jgi:putative ABC transport system substrate-binding protein
MSKAATSSSNSGSPTAIFPSGPQMAAELVALPVDVIVADGLRYATATDRIPIVAPALMNPVEQGFALSLARPGRNITGFTLMHTELNAKRLELLHTAFPHITLRLAELC